LEGEHSGPFWVILLFDAFCVKRASVDTPSQNVLHVLVSYSQILQDVEVTPNNITFLEELEN